VQRIPPFRSLDIFRGFAALWVVMCHSCVPWLVNQHMTFYSNPLYAFSTKGQLGVVIFFVISGYCITAAVYSAAHSGKPLRRYFYERVRRIYPPYLFALVMTAGANLAIRFAETHHLIGTVHHEIEVGSSLTYWAANLLLLQYEMRTSFLNIVFWSLGYEIAFYALMGIFLFGAQRVAKRKGPFAATMFLVVALGVSTTASLAYLLIAGKAIFPFDLWHLFALGGVLFFLIEMKPATMSGYTESARRIIWGTTGLVGLLTSLFAALREVGFTNMDHPSSRMKAMTAVLFCVALGCLRRYDERLIKIGIVRPLVFLGSFSYSLYLIHPVVLPFVDIAFRKAGFDGNRYLVTFAAEIAVSIVSGRLMFFGIERHFLSQKQTRRLDSEQVLGDVSLQTKPFLPAT
jgi:peptidoglycan/LPS O-acetylase OafA/YrhL